MNKVCDKHGNTDHAKRTNESGWRCRKCSSEAVAKRRRKVKEILVKESGGACVKCGYNKCLRALSFHHIDPKSKEFGIAKAGHTRGIARARTEIKKCILLCSNCHMEIEEKEYSSVPQR